jgi:hypothetical protein
MIPRGVKVSKQVREYDALVSAMTEQGNVALRRSVSRRGIWKQESPAEALKRFSSPSLKHPLYVT